MDINEIAKSPEAFKKQFQEYTLSICKLMKELGLYNIPLPTLKQETTLTRHNLSHTFRI